jgi:hypothetical protein
MKNEEREGGGDRSHDEKPYGKSDSARHQVISKSHSEDSLGGHSKASQQTVGHVGPRTTSNECETLGGILKKRQSAAGDAGTTSEPDETLGGKDKVGPDRPHFSKRDDIGQQSSRPGTHSGIPTAKNRNQQFHTVRTQTAATKK